MMLQMGTKVVVWGNGGHALVVGDIIQAVKSYSLVGFMADKEFEESSRLQCGSHFLGGRMQLSEVIRQGVRHAVVAVGNCHLRLELASMVCSEGFALATVIHPSAVVAPSAQVGAGTVIAAGAVLNPSATVGDNVIINTAATVDHECVIGDGAHLSPGCHLAGRVTVGRSTWIGIGAVVIDGIKIGSNSLVGAGAVVIEDIPDNVVVFGSPAKIVRKI